jgi:hypothetical protein
MLVYNGVGWGVIPAGPAGYVITSGGPGVVPAYQPASSGSVNSVTALTPLNSTGGANPVISVTGVIDAANGGTGLSSPGVLGNVLTSTGTGWASSAPPSVSPGAPLNSVQYNSAGSFAGDAALTWDGSTLAIDGALDRATAGTLTIGGSTATGVTIGQASPFTTTFLGDVGIQGNINTVGGTTFTDNVIFNGDTTFGNAITDKVSFIGQVDTEVTLEGIAAPAVAPAGTGRFYFDSSTNTFKASQNGGAYVDLVTGGTITGSGTATQIAYFTGASAIGSETAVGSNSFTWDATNNRLGVGTSTPSHVVDVQAGSLAGGGYALNVDATLTNVGGTVVSYIEGSVSAIVPVGTPIYGVVGYLSGAGVPSTSYAGNFGTLIAGSGQDPVSALQANFALSGSAAGATASGHNVGVMGLASNGARNYAVFGNTTGDGAGANVAVTGMAKNNSGIRIGGLFASQTTGASQPTVNTSAVLIADNMDLGDPIFLARDNGTTTFSIGNDGVVLAKNTANSTTAFSVQDSGGTTLLDVDTANDRVGVLTAAPVAALDLASGQLAIPDGSAAAPAIAFRDDLNTGLFSPGNDIVGMAVNGTEIARMQQTGAGLTPALLIGTIAPIGAISGSGNISVDSSDPSATSGVVMLAHGPSGTAIQESYRGGQFAGVRTLGTKTSPLQVLTDAGLWNAIGAGYTSAAGYNYGALITFKAEQAYTATASGGRIEFHTTLNGTDGITTLGGATTERMRITNAGRVGIGTPTPSSALEVSGVITATAGVVAPIQTNAQSASYILALSDSSKIVEIAVTGPATATVTVPANGSVPFPIGTQIIIAQTGTGAVSILADVGVTINYRTGLGLNFNGQWAVATVVKRATDTWVLFGDLV